MLLVVWGACGKATPALVVLGDVVISHREGVLCRLGMVPLGGAHRDLRMGQCTAIHAFSHVCASEAAGGKCGRRGRGPPCTGVDLEGWGGALLWSSPTAPQACGLVRGTGHRGHLGRSGSLVEGAGAQGRGQEKVPALFLGRLVTVEDLASLSLVTAAGPPCQAEGSLGPRWPWAWEMGR